MSKQVRFDIADREIDGDDYFVVIEPVFLAVSIYDGPETYSAVLQTRTRPSVRRAMCLLISDELENIFGFVSYIEPLQQRQVFIPKAPLRMCFSWVRM
jgi:hypothetical protein